MNDTDGEQDPDATSELEYLRTRLEEAEQLVAALRQGDLDGLVLSDKHANRLVTLDEADNQYRRLVEAMGDGALTLARNGVILYANRRLSDLLEVPLENLIGSTFTEWLGQRDQVVIQRLMKTRHEMPQRDEVTLVAASGNEVPAYITLSRLHTDDLPVEYCVVVTDLVEQKHHQAIAQSEQFARTILEQIAEAIVVVDLDGRIIRASQAAQALAGRNPVGRLFDESYKLEDDASHTVRLADIRNLGAARWIYGKTRFNDRVLSLRISSRSLCDASDSKIGSVIALTDISDLRQAEARAEASRLEMQEALEQANQSRRALLSVVEDQKQAEEALRENEARFRLVLDNSPISVFNQDRELRYTWIYHSSSGYTTETIAGMTDYDLFPVEDAKRLVELKSKVLEAGRSTREEVSLWVDGRARTFDVALEPMRDSGGDIIGVSGASVDVTMRKEAEEHINWLAHFDPLTELPNRTLFRDRLNHAMSLARRNNDHVAPLFLDLDHFKNINDTLGHQAGDKVLMQVARRMLETLREDDTVSRQGGDEFVVLLPETDAEGAVHVAEKLLTVFLQPFRIDGHDLAITASIGIAIYPENGDDIEELSRHADIAMYRAKRYGRNHYRFYNPEMQTISEQTLRLESDIRRVLEDGGLELHYQPQVSLIDGKVTGVEALLRWRHPEFGMISPAEFIPIAENSGQITTIGRWVLNTATNQLKAWLDAGLGPLTMAVNLSVRQLHEPEFVEGVEAAITHAGIEASCIELELTESMLMENQSEVIATLERINQLGVQLAIDDFGTGYSSLSYLKELPVDRLKIDRSFISDMEEKHDNAIIARSIIALGHSLGMKVIAEGVEVGGQLDFLKAHHCDDIQGYIFSKPLPRDDITRMLEEGRKMPLLVRHGEEHEKTLLIVDDEPNIRKALVRVLRGDGYRVLSVASGEEGLELLAQQPVNVIVSDQRMPGMSGVEFLSRVNELYPETVRVVLSGYTDLDSITDAINRGDIYKFLSKPWEDELLRASIREAFQHSSITHENERLARKLKEANKLLSRLQKS